jgi:flagellar protein FliO/FliZ
VVELVLRVVLSLAVVLGLLWFVARTSSRRLGGAARGLVRVVARQPLARTASLAVVEVGDRVLVLGVSENGVSLLTEMAPSELPVAAVDLAGDTAETADVPGSVVDAGSWLGKAAYGTDRGRGGRRAAPSPGLAGSVLSGQTWRQAWGAATSRYGGSGD